MLDDNTHPSNAEDTVAPKHPLVDKLLAQAATAADEAAAQQIINEAQKNTPTELLNAKSLHDFITLMKTDGGFRSQILRQAGLTNNSRPYGVYHKREYGEQLKVTLDLLLEQSRQGIYKPKRFLYKDYPKYKNKTLYHRVYQSIRYVVLEMDTHDSQYKNLVAQLEVCRETDGVYIRWRKDVQERDGILKAEDVEEGQDTPVNKSKAPRWKEKLDDFLEGRDTRDIFDEKVNLSTEEAAELQASINALGEEQFLAVVQPTRIKVVRISQ